ncbi:MAG: CHAT domain-containing protein [Planctomycetes bacterium]|nr:CHAT domain-containing protein [Planctomycetota bacterium]
MTTLNIRQRHLHDGKYPIALRLQRPGQADLEAEAEIEFALADQEQKDLRWYLEDYLEQSGSVEAVTVAQVETLMKTRGEELYTKVLACNPRTQAVWFAIREQLADLRIEITTGVAEAASIPWELMRDPQSASAISLRVKSFVRVQSNPNISFIPVPSADDGRVRLLYIVCRPGGSNDVELRAVANRVLQGLGADRARFQIKALRPPTFEQLHHELADAKAAGRPYHVVHFDGHGMYADLENTRLKDWLAALGHLTLGSKPSGKHGFLLFEHAGADQMRPVDGQTLGQLLHDSGTPILVLNACQSAMHEATAAPGGSAAPHDEIRAIGSLAQAVVDQGIPAVLGMRYSVYVVTAAQYISELYSALAEGRGFGEAASAGRKHLQLNPDRWVGLQPRPLQDWFVPVVYEALPIQLCPTAQPVPLSDQPEMDPVQSNRALRRYAPEHGFTGRDETLLALDRAFDSHRVVLLHAYAGQGKTTTAVEFARWYALTGGLGEQPIVLLASFESHTDLADLLNQMAQPFAPILEANGISWSAINDGAKRSRIVLQILRRVPVLWIWDNVEPVAGFPEGTESQWTRAEQEDLRDFLHQLTLDAASQVKVLLTSRRAEEGWLGGIPHRISMPRMRNSDAGNLARSLAPEKQISRADVAEWQPLLDYCQGNPLTLRVLVGQAVKMGLRGEPQIHQFVEAIRSGEQGIEDADETQGRDKSLGASLDYGFRNAFKEDELPLIALLHLFQGTVDVYALQLMGQVGEHALPELKGRSKEQLAGLLERARDTGLLTHLGMTYFGIHPALPWFLRRFYASHFYGQGGHSSASAALRGWVEAIGALGEFYLRRFSEGHPEIIHLVELEEANLLHARRLGRRYQWWTPLLSAMQGLSTLYTYQGRTAEWSRLVAVIVPDYCTQDDAPVGGRDEEYVVVMQFRVRLALQEERHLAKAAALQEKLVAWVRQRAASDLALPSDAPLEADQRNRLRTLSVAVGTLGNILRDQGDVGCLPRCRDAIHLLQRIGDKFAEAVAEFNLGHCYMQVPGICDLDAAEAAYQRSLDLRAPTDALSRSKCIKQIGMVHHERFKVGTERKQPVATLFRHVQAAERHYLEGLGLCPNDALTELATQHHQLGGLYTDVGKVESARHHLEQAAQFHVKTGDRHGAGQTRDAIALMYFRAAAREDRPPQQRDYLLRAQAYAEAALRDFQRYQGRAAKDEADAQRLLDHVHQALAKLPLEAQDASDS